MTHRPDGARTWAAFFGVVLIGGANFIAVSVSNGELPPLFGATLRFALAAVLFFLIGLVARVPAARGRAAVGAALYGVLGFGVAYAFLYSALVGLPAGTASVIVATAPLFTLVLAAVFGQERLSPRAVAGALLAIAGIAALSRGTLGGAIGGIYLVSGVLGTLALASASVVAKGLPDVHPLTLNTIGMAAGSVLLALGSRLLGETWTVPQAARTWAAVAWLVVLGSVGFFQLYLYVLRRWRASAAVYVVAGMPVVAVVLGAVILGQAVTAELLFGGGMVIAAVYVGAGGGGR
jgi:drug/metabolite transporter (DMT)-like permease